MVTPMHQAFPLWHPWNVGRCFHGPQNLDYRLLFEGKGYPVVPMINPFMFPHAVYACSPYYTYDPALSRLSALFADEHARQGSFGFGAPTKGAQLTDCSPDGTNDFLVANNKSDAQVEVGKDLADVPCSTTNTAKKIRETVPLKQSITPIVTVLPSAADLAVTAIERTLATSNNPPTKVDDSVALLSPKTSTKRSQRSRGNRDNLPPRLSGSNKQHKVSSPIDIPIPKPITMDQEFPPLLPRSSLNKPTVRPVARAWRPVCKDTPPECAVLVPKIPLAEPCHRQSFNDVAQCTTLMKPVVNTTLKEPIAVSTTASNTTTLKSSGMVQQDESGCVGSPSIINEYSLFSATPAWSKFWATLDDAHSTSFALSPATKPTSQTVTDLAAVTPPPVLLLSENTKSYSTTTTRQEKQHNGSPCSALKDSTVTTPTSNNTSVGNCSFAPNAKISVSPVFEAGNLRQLRFRSYLPARPDDGVVPPELVLYIRVNLRLSLAPFLELVVSAITSNACCAASVDPTKSPPSPRHKNRCSAMYDSLQPETRAAKHHMTSPTNSLGKYTRLTYDTHARTVHIVSPKGSMSFVADLSVARLFTELATQLRANRK